jgi:GntR family transcriptional regulator / MocR family aminotransferase
MDFLLALARRSGIPLHVQLEDEVRAAIRAGRLRAGVELPSTRSLAAELGISRGIVVEAYGQLRAEGYLDIDLRGKTRIAQVAEPAQAETSFPRHSSSSILYDFHPGLPDLQNFPRNAWAGALRAALREAHAADFGYSDPRGAAPLREALAAHLGRARGALANPDRILVTDGFTQGLALVCAALRVQGVSRIAVEDPCLPLHRAIVQDAGIEPVPIPVDEHGVQVDRLARQAVGAVLLTPAHQFPIGAVLAPERRAAVVEWAREHDAYILEDDYDAEYRYDREPIGALQGLAPERVVYGGSASKTLAPALRLGWLLLPEELFPAVLERKILSGGSALPKQLALASWLRSGEFHRHLRRMRLRYHARRDAIIAALHSGLPAAQLEGVAAGLHVVAYLPARTDEQRLVTAAARRGVSVHPLLWHRTRPEPGRPGLVLGYASLGEAAIRRGVREISRALESL